MLHLDDCVFVTFWKVTKTRGFRIIIIIFLIRKAVAGCYQLCISAEEEEEEENSVVSTFSFNCAIRPHREFGCRLEGHTSC